MKDTYTVKVRLEPEGAWTKLRLASSIASRFAFTVLAITAVGYALAWLVVR